MKKNCWRWKAPWRIKMPDTSAYLVYGYIVIFGILTAYIVSLAARAKRVHKKLNQLETKN